MTPRHAPNHTARAVKSGHYVMCAPTPLPEPRLVTFSAEMAAELGLSEEACRSDAFKRVFSGDLSEAPQLISFATPYALSIFGQAIPAPDPFGGYGYGDGRAVSLGEVELASGKRWEFQLKGGGPTPFCRGADGRAVLRSSVREFLASEAMHAFGVSTTRAISLVASNSETVARPWYSNSKVRSMGPCASGGVEALPTIRPSPPRLSAARLHTRLQAADVDDNPQLAAIYAMMGQGASRDPDMMQEEQCAITTRVAPSFLRVGHFELYARRASRGIEEGRVQLEQLFRHLVSREYADEVDGEAPLGTQVLSVLDCYAQRLCDMVAGWIRVGYVQVGGPSRRTHLFPPAIPDTKDAPRPPRHHGKTA